MRTIFASLITLGFTSALWSQPPMKHIPNAPYVAPAPLSIAHAPSINVNAGRTTHHLPIQPLHQIGGPAPEVNSMKMTTSGSFWIEMKPNQLWQNRSSVTDMVEKIIPAPTMNAPFYMDWDIVSQHADADGVNHIRLQQRLMQIPIKGQDLILHVDRNQLKSLNGFAWTGHIPAKLVDPKSIPDAIQAAKDELKAKNVVFQSSGAMTALSIPADNGSKIWFPRAGKLIQAYEIDLHPNALDHWTVYVNAGTLEILESIKQTCSFAPLQLYPEKVCEAEAQKDIPQAAPSTSFMMPLLDGATVTTDQDLLSQNRTINAYQVSGTFYMIDASRTTMFQANQSVMPNDPVGVIWTVDAQNASPQQSNFEVVHVTNTNNNWKALEVSAHYNAGQAFEYYRNTFTRNSINGSGGNIISIINVTDENDNNMDNAYWNGSAMFYGNGDVAFKQLARGLDVSGHEMSHGVIQSTANLEYLGQSGALNESYADVFGSLIDRDDWRIGEDVVNTSFFPSGALRDLSNPNNGGNGPNDPGWQPKNMSEFQNLPATPDGDNGGVHVNSGIPNRAYFLIANVIGKDKAEKIYYKALTDYLVKSSQFIDMRNAVEKAATDLFGNGAEVTAVKNAFDTVGIGAGQGGDYEGDIDTNNGADFILATDGTESDLYFIPPGNPDQFVKMNVPAPISRPSFTDDGSACVYVNDQNDLIVIQFDWSTGLSYQAFFIENNPQHIWRNIAVSKDGSKIAFTTSNLRNEINVFDFTSNASNTYTLFNPTTASGGLSTGDVEYPDAMEWDYSGEFVMYDALNQIQSTFGNGIEYWDISFLHAWNTATNSLGDGQIGKLYTNLPENVSIGNPSFSKNSPYIITFDYLEDYFDNFGTLQTDYWVVAANIENGTGNNIYHNNTVGYPSYSRLDDKILFTFDNSGSLLLATINTQPGDKTLPVTGTDVILINGAQKGVWFQTGNRIFTGTKDVGADPLAIRVLPQPASDAISVGGIELTGDQSYSIADFTGRQILNGSLESNRQINIHDLAAGTYVLQIITKSGIQKTARFVKL